MTTARPSFFARFALAFRVLFSSELARRLVAPALPSSGSTDADEAKSDAPPPRPEPRVHRAVSDAALQLLALLQREGRFIDFLKEDVSSFSDEEIGAAARVVHQGCVKALDEHLSIEPIREESEGEPVTLSAGFNAAEVRVTGNVVGEPPFRGTVQHRGWKVSKVELPKLTEDHDVSVIAAAEVEL